MIDKNSIKYFYNNIYKKGDIRDNPRLYRWIMYLLKPSGATNLLDIGCGIGCLLFEANNKRISTFGLDISYDALCKVKHDLPTAKVCVADGENIPFKDNTFDSIASLGSIEHFLHPAAGIKEACRLLKNNGRAVFILPNSFYLGDILKVLFKGKQDEQWQIQEKLLSKEQWRLLIEENGLQVENIYKYNKYPELFQEGTYKIKSIKKYIKTCLMKYLCPFNLSWQFIYVCRK